MFRRFLLICFSTCFIYGIGYGQNAAMNKYANQLFLNIFKDTPDPAIQDFLKSYLPVLAEKKTTEFKLSANKAAEEDPEEIHSFVFTQHPFFKAQFARGKIDFICTRNPVTKTVLVNNVKLWFEFSSQSQGEMAFNYLIESLMPISTIHKFGSTNGAQRAEFSDAKEKNGFGKVRIRLTADNLDRNVFKILFELENEL